MSLLERLQQKPLNDKEREQVLKPILEPITITKEKETKIVQPKIEKPLNQRNEKELEFKKRYFDKLNSEFVLQFPLFELIRELCDKLFGNRY